MAGNDDHKVSLTTGIGTLSFPHVFRETATQKTNDKGEKTGEIGYDIQIIIPKTQKKDLQKIVAAIKEVGEAKWGDRWKQVRSPLRDGDAEADRLATDGKTMGEKYPERLGCFFLNTRSQRPVGVFDRERNVINDPDAVYGGCKGKVNITFYPYNRNGNQGIAAGLTAVQKVADGEPFGGGAPTAESMFDIVDDETVEDMFGGDEDEVEEKPKKAKDKKAKKGGKKSKKKDGLDDLDV